MIVDCAVYDDGQRTQQHLELREAYELGSSGDGRFVWIGLHDPTADELDSVAREFDLHELAAEDATRPRQRPKLEVYDDTECSCSARSTTTRTGRRSRPVRS